MPGVPGTGCVALGDTLFRDHLFLISPPPHWQPAEQSCSLLPTYPILSIPQSASQIGTETQECW